MENEIIVALIGVAGTLIATWIAQRYQEKARVLEVEKQAVTKAVQEMSERSSYEVREFECVTTIHDDGSGQMVRKWVDVTTTTQGITNLKIRTRLGTSYGKNETLAIEALPTSDLPVHFEPISQSDTTTEGNVVLDGVLTPARRASFVITQKFAGGFCLTKEEATEKYRGSPWTTEYAVSEVFAPTQVLKRTVEFPPSHKELHPKPNAVVFIGSSEEVDLGEVARIQPGLTVLSGSAVLVVQKPLIGRRYGIAWMPPPVSKTVAS